MKKFSINELEHFTGIKAHTLRIWEKRYQFPQPLRTASNIRYYSVEQLKHLLHIATLNRGGQRISHLSQLSFQQLNEKIKHSDNNDLHQECIINELIIAMYLMNIYEFEKILNQCFLIWSSASVLSQVIFPFLKKTKIFYDVLRTAQEQMVAAIIRKKIIWAIEEIEATQQPGPTVLLFLTRTKPLDLPLLYMHFQLKLKGYTVIEMGNDVSPSFLPSVIEKLQPAYIYTYLRKTQKNIFSELMLQVKYHSSKTKLLITLIPDEEYYEEENVWQISYDNVLRLLCY